MSQRAHQIDNSTLRNLLPLGTLTDADLRHLLDCAELLRLQPGEILETSDDHTRFLDYLISGEIELRGGNQSQQFIHQDTLEASRPLSDCMTQYEQIVAHTHCAILRINQEQLELSLQTDWQPGHELSKLTIDNEQLVIDKLLQNPILRSLPADKFKSVMQHMHLIEVEAGETIIWQGDHDDSYYSILSGHCLVSRRPHIMAKDIIIAELGPGKGFGEDALITNKKRNASITMKTDGMLMRLDRQHFLHLIVEQLISFYDYEQIASQVHKGAIIIDVRSIDEYKRNGIGLHIPLPMLRRRLETISHGNEYIFCCDDGQLAVAAAFIAIEYGFRSSVLRNGLNAVSHLNLKHAH